MPKADCSYTTFRAELAESAAVPLNVLPPVAAVLLEAGAGAQSRASAVGPLDRDQPEEAESSVQATQRWSVYKIERHEDGRAYVGVTSRPLADRLAAHELLARKHPELGGTGSLAQAIRRASDAGVAFDQAFSAQELEQTSSPAEARALERKWITLLGTRSPHGFNLMPGGSSIGGPANSVPVTISHPARGSLTYGSTMESVAAINRERACQGRPPLDLSGVYARRVLGWSLEEALELTSHADGRRERPLFCWHGRTYSSLAELSAVEGLPISTIRSRLHRARRAGCGADQDVALDRRRAGSQRTGGLGCGRQAPLVLPHPHLADATVDARTFGRLTGVPRATVLNRYRQLVDAGQSVAQMPREDVIGALTRRQDRRLLITLELADGRMLRDGVRGLVRWVLADHRLRRSRPEALPAMLNTKSRPPSPR